MLMSIGTMEDDTKVSTDCYYYPPITQTYYPSVPFNDESNHLCHYETNHYYTFPYQPMHFHSDKEIPNHPTYRSTCQHYSPDEHANEMLYSQKPAEQHLIPVHDYNTSSALSLPSSYFQPSSASSSTDYSMPCPSPKLTAESGSIIVELINQPLWFKFAPHTLENIITKTGRRMFPILEFKVHGLKADSTYNMYVDMVLVNTNYWKFHSGKWIPSGPSEQCQNPTHRYLHPDSPNSGAHWMKNAKISFSKLKLTNNKKLLQDTPQNQATFLLHSMHKYMPRLNIVQVNDRSLDPQTTSEHSFTFPETQFIAVTAYQNTDITQLKIDHNPFAKGFREVSDHQNTYHSYAYGSENTTAMEFYERTYEHQPPHKKKRQH